MNYTDLLGREINIGDYVVFYCRIHQVQEKMIRETLSIKEIDSGDYNCVGSDNLCIIDKEDVLAWKLRKNPS